MQDNNNRKHRGSWFSLCCIIHVGHMTHVGSACIQRMRRVQLLTKQAEEDMWCYDLLLLLNAAVSRWLSNGLQNRYHVVATKKPVLIGPGCSCSCHSS
jgi:hypothetical protein